MSIDYVSYFDDVIAPELCDAIIEKFENSPEHQQKTYYENHRSFTEINLTKHPEWKLVQEQLHHGIMYALPYYKRQWKIDEQLMFPDNHGWEQFRMKRYLPGEDEFKFHVDVQDYASARRFLVAFFYLNDVEVGGETIFQDTKESLPKMFVKPKTGRLIVFPALWTHPHIGAMPISGAKYIVGTYLHYV
jgi:hypothetical protein